MVPLNHAEIANDVALRANPACASEYFCDSAECSKVQICCQPPNTFQSEQSSSEHQTSGGQISTAQEPLDIGLDYG